MLLSLGVSGGLKASAGQPARPLRAEALTCSWDADHTEVDWSASGLASGSVYYRVRLFRPDGTQYASSGDFNPPGSSRSDNFDISTGAEPAGNWMLYLERRSGSGPTYVYTQVATCSVSLPLVDISCSWDAGTRVLTFSATALSPSYCYRVRLLRPNNSQFGEKDSDDFGFGTNRSGTFTIPAGEATGTWTIVLDRDSNSGCDSTLEYPNLDSCTFDIAASNSAPVADNDSYSTNEDTTLNVSAPGVLDGDTDADGNPLTAIKVSDPATVR